MSFDPLADAAERKYLLNLPTTLSLPPKRPTGCGAAFTVRSSLTTQSARLPAIASTAAFGPSTSSMRGLESSTTFTPSLAFTRHGTPPAASARAETNFFVIGPLS